MRCDLLLSVNGAVDVIIVHGSNTEIEYEESLSSDFELNSEVSDGESSVGLSDTRGAGCGTADTDQSVSLQRTSAQ